MGDNIRESMKKEAAESLSRRPSKERYTNRIWKYEHRYKLMRQ